MKYLLSDYVNPNQQLLTIKDVLKESIFSKKSNQANMINESPTIVCLLKKVKQRKNNMRGSNVNTR